MFETNLAGNDLGPVIENIPKIDQCQDLCSADPECKFWSYKHDEEKCQKKTSDAGKAYDYHFMSGANDCSPYHPSGIVIFDCLPVTPRISF